MSQTLTRHKRQYEVSHSLVVFIFYFGISLPTISGIFYNLPFCFCELLLKCLLGIIPTPSVLSYTLHHKPDINDEPLDHVRLYLPYGSQICCTTNRGRPRTFPDPRGLDPTVGPQSPSLYVRWQIPERSEVVTRLCPREFFETFSDGGDSRSCIIRKDSSDDGNRLR